MHPLSCSVLLLANIALAAPAAQCTANAGYDVELVLQRSLNLSSHSWEFGTASEALLELRNPALAVFNPAAFPSGKIPVPCANVQSLEYAKLHINLTHGDTLIDGDGASGDPASLGVSAILLGQRNSSYAAAAQRQATHLLQKVPRLSNGAISQRDNSIQAWADFMYMAPPFLAYYAVATNNVTLLKETVRQCGLYRQILHTNLGLWKHIVTQTDEPGSANADPGLWSTGNAWAIAGMARVLATATHWSGASALNEERADLTSWIKEIVDGAKAQTKQDGLLRNYLNDTTWFGETSGTALTASTVYRMAKLAPSTFSDSYVKWADDLRQAVASHVTKNGTLSPAVNPLGWGDHTPYTAGSPEGQSFGVLLYSAYRDYTCNATA